MRYGAVWLILFLSKFVILEAVNVIFGNDAELGSGRSGPRDTRPSTRPL